MVLSLTPADGLGLLQPLVDDALARGEEVGPVIGQRLVRGDPPLAMLPASSRARVEAEWQLGPLLVWYPTRRGWRLEDTTTLAGLDLGGAPATAPPVPREDRTRLGHPSEHPRFPPLAGAEADAEERRRVAHPTWEPPPPPPGWGQVRHVARRVETAAPAEQVLARLLEVLAGLPDLPAWFRAGCAPPRGSSEEVARRSEAVALRGLAARRAGWALMWTPDEVLRHLDPAERVWRFHSARVVDDRTLDLAVEISGPGAPTTALKWLLVAAGAARCRPGVPPSELGFGPRPASAP